MKLSAKCSILIAIVLYVTGILAYSFYSYNFTKNRILEKDYTISMQATVAGTAAILGNSFHQRAVKKDAVGDDEYAANTLKLSDFAKSVNACCLYTVIVQNNKIFFTASSTTERKLPKNNLRSYFMPYNDAPPELFKAFATMAPVRVEYKTTGKRKKLKSLFLPFTTPDGQVYVACADYKTEHLDKYLAENFNSSLLFAIVAIALVLPLMYVHARIEKQQQKLLVDKQAQLSHAGRLTAIGEMTAGMAHEINQPLCVIRGYLELLKAVLKDNPVLKEKELDEAFDVSIVCVDKASRIINHMRNFVRLKYTGAAPVNLGEVIDEGLSFFNEQIRLHDITLLKEFGDELPKVRIDPQRFEQVVVNLISNARYAVDKKSEEELENYTKEITLKLYSSESADKVFFEITDNGTGMTKEVLNKCTEAFYTTKEVGAGTGLGMSIVQDIIKEYDGSMDIQSENAKGTTVKISFSAHKN